MTDDVVNMQTPTKISRRNSFQCSDDHSSGNNILQTPSKTEKISTKKNAIEATSIRVICRVRPVKDPTESVNLDRLRIDEGSNTITAYEHPDQSKCFAFDKVAMYMTSKSLIGIIL